MTYKVIAYTLGALVAAYSALMLSWGLLITDCQDQGRVCGGDALSTVVREVNKPIIQLFVHES